MAAGAHYPIDGSIHSKTIYLNKGLMITVDVCRIGDAA